MEQRALRLGDIVDDYCPRERRVTNHTIVALIDETIRQTRCATCETEHEYKEARVPIKKAKTDSADAGSPLAGGVLVPARPPAVAPASDSGEDSVAPANGSAASESVRAEAAADAATDGPITEQPIHDGWLAHRPLIRATLPKVEGEQPPPRAIPEFTMHQRPGRGFGGRGFRPGPSGDGNGGPSRDGNGPGGNRPPGGKPGRHRRRNRRPR